MPILPIKVGMISLGCPKNQVDAEQMLASLRGEGFVLTPDAGEADVVVVNTCGFIEDAKRESIENILEMGRLKKEGTIKGIVVTGCLAQRYFKEMQEEFPEVDCILTVGSAGAIARAVRAAAAGEKLHLCSDPENLPMNGGRVLSTLPFYAYLKIAEGCDNCCSYCVIPSLRGRYRSRPPEEIVREAEDLCARGVKEIVLVAQDTTRYGEDLPAPPAQGAKTPVVPTLAALMRSLCRIEGLQWLRVLYCYPECITDELIDTVAEEEKIVKYFDIPIQHVSHRVLRAMNRRGGRAELTALLQKIRARIPGVVLRTTVMTGFPGETEEEFTELTDFLREIGFERLGAFAYSREEGTPAARMENQVDEDVKHRRQEIVMEQQTLVSEAYNKRQLGHTVRVLAEGYDRYAGCWFGRSCADAPDIDGKVFFKTKTKIKPGNFLDVHVDEVLDYDLVGTAVSAASPV